jgi:hypothetical protein
MDISMLMRLHPNTETCARKIDDVATDGNAPGERSMGRKRPNEVCAAVRKILESGRRAD